MFHVHKYNPLPNVFVKDKNRLNFLKVVMFVKLTQHCQESVSYNKSNMV